LKTQRLEPQAIPQGVRLEDQGCSGIVATVPSRRIEAARGVHLPVHRAVVLLEAMMRLPRNDSQFGSQCLDHRPPRFHRLISARSFAG
jgi:hypothetical protein